MPGEFIARQGLISRGNVVVTGSLSTSGSLTTTGTITATTLIVQTITSSISSITGSTNFGSLSSNTHVFTGSIYTSGSVGIGTANPSAVFEVARATTSSINLANFLNSGSITGTENYIWIGKDNSTTGRAGLIDFIDNTDGASGYLALAVQGDNPKSGTGLMVKKGGNVGIGTSSPNQKLEVWGATRNYVAAGYYSDFAYNGTTYNFGSGETTDNVDFKIAGGGTWTSGGNFRFWTQTGNTTPVERMRITSGGNFCVATTSVLSPGGPDGVSNMLNPNNDGKWALALQNNATTNNLGRGIGIRNITDFNNGSNEFLFLIGNNTPRLYVQSNGGVYNYSANNSNLSDIRTKKDIIPLESYWDKFKAIEIVKFKYKDQTHDDYNIGVIAQQVLEIAPEFVNEEGFGGEDYIPEDGIPLKSIYSEDLHNATIKVLQEAMAKIETLEAKVQYLENK
jgi:hypothetical protein